MIDQSNFEALHLLLRPFTDELGEGWRVIRAVCVLFLVVTVVLWISSAVASEETFARAKQILNISGWVTFLMFVFTYAACCVEAYTRSKEREEERLRKYEEFH